jgi:hypothetical protein
MGSLGPWSGGLTARDVNCYRQDPNLTLPRTTATVYRRYLRWDRSPRTLQGGDLNTLMGRGMLLSVVDSPALLKEEALDGFDGRYRAGRIELHGLSGTVTPESQDQSWRVAGGEADLEYLRGQHLGLAACTIQDGRLPRFGIPVGLRQGCTVHLSGSFAAGSLNYYLERGWIDFRDRRPLPFPSRVDPTRGEAAYGNLSFHHKAWYLMAEAKAYTNFDTALNNPPLADRDTEKNDLYDGSGRRLYVQYAFPEPDLTLFLSAGRYREETWDGQNVYGGFKLQDLFDRLDLACTYGLKTVRYPEKKSNLALTWRLTPLWSLGLTRWDKRNHPPGAPAYQETDVTVQVARSPRLAVYVTQQRSSLPVFDATRLYCGGIRINLKEDSYLELSGGRQRGGEACAGGQCAILPPFRGWKLAAHVRW